MNLKENPEDNKAVEIARQGMLRGTHSGVTTAFAGFWQGIWGELS